MDLKDFYHRKLARPFYSLIRPLQPIFDFKKRTFFDKFKVKTKNGLSFWLFNNAFYWETEIFWQGFNKINWEVKTREIWEELSKQSHIILDIGANTGIFSVLAKAYNPQAEVHAFEPQPNVFKVLEKNNHINCFDIQCHQVALSDKSGELPFYNTGYSTFEENNTTHGSLNKEWRTEHQHSILVQVDRLDRFLEKHRIGQVDLIKIDVETLEYEVLSGYGELLLKHRSTIILEIQSAEIGDNLSTLFENEGYCYFWINEEKGLVKVDKLGRNTSQDHLNYLICPKTDLNRVQKWL